MTPPTPHHDPRATAPAPTGAPAPDIVRRRWDIRGRVQGVGFRPFIYRLACEEGLAGEVGNDAQGAFIEAEGPLASLDRLAQRIDDELPPLASIADQEVTDLPVTGGHDFVIRPSRDAGPRHAQVTPDAATCDDCLAELADPADRRYRYPFINCTNCGPRYSILRTIPYDRPNTTMAAFTMCPDCQREYDHPGDRRFHAQPNACPQCGPRVTLVDADGNDLAAEPIAAARELLREGRILAVKGLGGVHLACRADQDPPVAELRRRKRRDAKPLAVMVADLAAARRYVELSGPAADALASPQRPIVLAPNLPDAPVSKHVAPGSDALGLLLPYTPLHQLLLDGLDLPLVMTSGNPAGQPLCHDNDEALLRLADIADAFLLHDRDIHRPIDDSVVLAVDLPASAGGSTVVPLRRARGYVPTPIDLPAPTAEPILAVGAQMKSVLCLADGRRALCSEHLGDLDHPAALRNFMSAVDQFQQLTDIHPARIACDLHPDYAATRYARRLGLPLTEVQHHHAHLASCLADNGLTAPAVGIVCDGTGYGTDGTIWGGELLVGDAAQFLRAGHLRTFRLPGGDVAAVETWRPAAALLADAIGREWAERENIGLDRVDTDPLQAVRTQLAGDRWTGPITSSLGRLFDAAAFLTGLCDRNRCQAQAPMALQAAAGRCRNHPDPLPVEVADTDEGVIIDHRPWFADLAERVARGEPTADLARAFHNAIIAAFAEGAERVARRYGLDRVVLSGGCLANRLLLAGLARALAARQLTVYTHRRVPPGDGGVALGQVAVAAASCNTNADLTE